MKKTLMLLVLVLGLSTVIVSCKDKKEQEVQTESQENMAADEADIAMNDVFQCPMDCEDGKTYDAEGKCPVCAMDLKKVEGLHQHDDGEVHEDHEDDHDGEDND